MFDEADMLLSGGFENKVIRLIHMLRYEEKQLSWSKGPSPISLTHLEPETSEEYSLEDDNDSKLDVDSDGEGSSGEDLLVGEAEPGKRTDWRRVRKNYERSKQYIFVAATLPLNGKKTPGAVLKKMFPDSNWVSGNYLHRHNPR